MAPSLEASFLWVVLHVRTPEIFILKLLLIFVTLTITVPQLGVECVALSLLRKVGTQLPA